MTPFRPLRPLAARVSKPADSAARSRDETRLVDTRVVMLVALAAATAGATALIAQGLLLLIAGITHVAYYGALSVTPVSPAGNHLGWAAVLVPVVGALLVGVMARYGSPAIRGHGIPEAMERVLRHQSRIPARLTVLKPLSAAISIGTGGPFGAEGPIIATGSALGSLVGQWFPVSPRERKTLLAAGAAAGMAATFGSPVAAVLLAIELLLFEFSPRSVLPVGVAAVTATAVRSALVGAGPVFPMPSIPASTASALAVYVTVGAVMGLGSVVVTRTVYAVEDLFDRLPLHWMWWPALGAIVVGIVGVFAPHTLGVGYDNLQAMVTGSLTVHTLVVLGVLKFVSWAISLGSGTSGGTLAPIFTIGGAAGAVLGVAFAALLPSAGIDIRVAALVGMASLFAGSSRALLTSVVFAFETTRQPAALLPLLGACVTASLVSTWWMRDSIMTTRMARRGVRVPVEYVPDPLRHRTVAHYAHRDVFTLHPDESTEAVRARVTADTHRDAAHGMPVVSTDGSLLGVLLPRDLDTDDGTNTPIGDLVTRPAVTITEDTHLDDAMLAMLDADVGCLAVLTDHGAPGVVGMLTRGDVLSALQYEPPHG